MRVRVEGRAGIKGAFSHLGNEHGPSPLHLRRLKSQHHDFSSSTIHPPHPPLLMASLPRRALGHSILLPHTSSDGLVAWEAQGFLPPPFPPPCFSTPLNLCLVGTPPFLYHLPPVLTSP